MKTFSAVFTLLLLVLFGALAVRAIGDPPAAANGFGLPLGSSEYLRIYGSRNLALAVAAVALLALGETRALAIVLTCAAALPIFDMAILGAASPRHLASLVLVASAAALQWRIAR
jgi:hypothetical protein